MNMESPRVFYFVFSFFSILVVLLPRLACPSTKWQNGPSLGLLATGESSEGTATSVNLSLQLRNVAAAWKSVETLV